MNYAAKCESMEKHGIASLANELACRGYPGDHITICGFFTSDEQFAKHAESLRSRLAGMKRGKR